MSDTIANNNNHEETEKLHSGVLKTIAIFATCVFVSKEAGTLKPLDLSIPKEAMLNCMKTTSKSKRVDEMACMVNTNNRKRLVMDNHSLYQNLKLHDGVYVHVLVNGNWAKEPLTDLAMKQKCIHITAFLPTVHCKIVGKENFKYPILGSEKYQNEFLTP